MSGSLGYIQKSTADTKGFPVYLRIHCMEREMGGGYENPNNVRSFKADGAGNGEQKTQEI